MGEPDGNHEPMHCILSGKNKAIAVNHDVTFDALDLLVCVKSIVTLTVAPFNALGIQCSHRGTSD